MDDYVKRKNPFGWNNTIILICLIIYIIKIICLYFLKFNPIDIFLALNPAYILLMPWQILTSIFVHADFWHLFINMFVLFFFGSELERRLGSKKYLTIFFASGISGSLAYIFYSFLTNHFIPAMGASAAIFGVMGALAMIAPETKVIIFPIPIPISIRFAIMIFALYDLIFLPFTYGTGVAHISHLAGLAVGLYFGRRYRVRRIFYGYY